MPKLAKNMYTTAKGERKLNCYVVNIPKEVVEKTNLKDVDLKISSKDNKIIIENWEEQQELTNYLQQENLQLKERIEKAIEYLETATIDPQSMLNYRNCLLDILKGDNNE